MWNTFGLLNDNVKKGNEKYNNGNKLISMKTLKMIGKI